MAVVEKMKYQRYIRETDKSAGLLLLLLLFLFFCPAVYSFLAPIHCICRPRDGEFFAFGPATNFPLPRDGLSKIQSAFRFD